jgi:hypothetical protein
MPRSRPAEPRRPAPSGRSYPVNHSAYALCMGCAWVVHTTAAAAGVRRPTCPVAASHRRIVA